MKKLYRSQRDKKIFGLCGGLAEMLNVDANLLRLVVVITALFTGGTVLFIYVIASLVISKQPMMEPSMEYAPTVGNFAGTYGMNNTQEPVKTNIDEMMKDIEKKAMWKELEELRSKIAKYEKGEV
jgi:phage shock protein C